MVLRWLYFVQLRHLPGSWERTLDSFQGDGPLLRWVRRALGRLGRRTLAQVDDSLLVIATHPFASQMLGEGRRRGWLAAPVATYLTDASVHPLWVHPDVDLHVAVFAEAERQAGRLGVEVARARPVIADVEAVDVPTQIPWSADQTPVVLLVGGACGVGDLEQAARDVLATGMATPVVACGSNRLLQDRLAKVPGVVALGWRDDLVALLAGADCVVQNAGGMTALQALAVGSPLLTYRAIPGHGVTNAEALDRSGLVPWVRTPEALAPALREAFLTRGATCSAPSAPLAAELLAEAFSLPGSHAPAVA